MDFLSTKEVAELWNISQRRIVQLAKDGKIPGATQFGHSWMIPENAKKPPDGRSSRQGTIALQKALSEQKALYRFPFFVDFAPESFTPPLSKQEALLQQAQIDFFACEFEKCTPVLHELIKSGESIYIKITALFFRCLEAVYFGTANEFKYHYSLFRGLLAQDFAHKTEMELLHPFLFAYLQLLGDDLIQYQFDPEYQYSPIALSVLSLLSFYRCCRESSDNNTKPLIDIFELECRNSEDNGHFFLAQEFHFALYFLYNLLNDKSLKEYHLRKALQIARERNLLLAPACYYYFFSHDFAIVSKSFPKDLVNKIQSYSPSVISRYTDTLKNLHITDIFASLDKDDFQFVYYAIMGYSLKSVAEIYKLSERTVATRYGKIYEKLGINNKNELVKYFSDYAFGHHEALLNKDVT